MRGKGPQFTRFLWPVIEALKELGGSGKPNEIKEIIFKKFNITDDEILPSGTPKLYNQIQWARLYLVKSGHLDSSQRGVWNLTKKGREAERFSNEEALRIFNEVQKDMKGESAGSKRKKADDEDKAEFNEDGIDSAAAPENDYRERVIKLLLDLPSGGFERLCQRLLRESGFERVEITGRSGDGGIDGKGIIQVNPFVSFNVIFQCKRYKDTVSPAQVREFRGAMMGRVDKGIMITTGFFTKAAISEAVRDGAQPIELVDGEKLIDLLTKFELGLKRVDTYEVEDSFFEEYKT
jgi:restriction system protein